MKKFFDLSSFEKNHKKKPTRHHFKKQLGCAQCELYLNVRSPKMAAFGNFRKRILNIGEAPGEVEDQEGQQWQGPVGKFLRKTYQKFGVDLFEDCLNINTVNCRPTDERGNNRAPTSHEIACCRTRVLSAINKHKPSVIILLGNAAVESVIGHVWKKNLGTITRWRGWIIPDRTFKAWLCPTYHPSFVGRSEEDSVAETVWLQDLEHALEKSVVAHLPEGHEERDVSHPTRCVTLVDSLRHVAQDLKNRKDKLISIDYETTGLKPHADGHRIVCAAVAVHHNHSYAFMMTEENKKSLVELLGDAAVSKSAHNLKFEDTWSTEYLKQPVQNWAWDSMLAAHVLDNRPLINSLKFQVYVNFGTADYSSEIEPYLKSRDEKNANAFNRVDELLQEPGGQEKLLTYCGLDALYGYRLAELQMERLGYDKRNI